MTENEIIQILKDNKKNGIGWNFLPEQVKIWTRNIVNYNKCIRFDGKDWISLNNVNLWDKTDNTEIIALSEDFELKKEVEGEWVDFDIELDGCFKANNIYYYWTKWGDFINEYNGKDNYTAFGGWQYENDNRWYMAPVVKNENNIEYWNSYTDDKEFIKPCIPIKIRFWKSI